MCATPGDHHPLSPPDIAHPTCAVDFVFYHTWTHGPYHLSSSISNSSTPTSARRARCWRTFQLEAWSSKCGGRSVIYHHLFILFHLLGSSFMWLLHSDFCLYSISNISLSGAPPIIPPQPQHNVFSPGTTMPEESTYIVFLYAVDYYPAPTHMDWVTYRERVWNSVSVSRTYSLTVRGCLILYLCCLYNCDYTDCDYPQLQPLVITPHQDWERPVPTTATPPTYRLADVSSPHRLQELHILVLGYNYYSEGKPSATLYLDEYSVFLLCILCLRVYWFIVGNPHLLWLPIVTFHLGNALHFCFLCIPLCSLWKKGMISCLCNSSVTHLVRCYIVIAFSPMYFIWLHILYMIT